VTDLPRGWAWKALGEIAEVIGGVTKDGKRETGKDLVEVPYLRVANVQRGRIDISRIASIRVPIKKAEKLALMPGDVLLNEGGDRDKLGRGWVWDGQIPRCIHQNHVFRARIRNDALHPRLLAWYANEVAHQWFESNGRQSVNLASISLSKIRTFPVPIPPLDEQRRIVEILEDHLSRLDVAARELQRGADKLGVLLNVIRFAAFRCGDATEGQMSRLDLLTIRECACSPGMKRGRPAPVPPAVQEVPWGDRWPTLSLEEVTDPQRTISYGILKPGPNLPGGVPYVRVVNMRGDVIDTLGLHRTTRDIAEAYGRAALEPEDVLVSIRGTYGRVAVVPESLRGANITQDTARIACLQHVLPEFVAEFLRSPFAQAHMKSVARGVAVKGVNIGDLRGLPIPVPNIGEQRRIVDRIRAAVDEVERIQAAINAARQRGCSLRRALLAHAFSGRLTGVRDVSEVVEEMAGV
jgi:restriction endonuclease S subunit